MLVNLEIVNTKNIGNLVAIGDFNIGTIYISPALCS